MISVRNLVKQYGVGARSRLAVNDLSFEVEAGEVVGFLGPNGAGKTTTLRILTGFLAMTRGTVRVAGIALPGLGRPASLEARRRVGYMPEAVPLYPEMRVAEYLTFRAELKGIPWKKCAAYVVDAMEKTHVRELANTCIAHLSKGMRQRVGLADALVARPSLVILDEPTAGLDPNQVREVRALVQALARDTGCTLFLSTHLLREVEAMCGRVVVIDRGKLVAEGTIRELAQKRRSSGVSLVLRGDRERIARVVTGEGFEAVFDDADLASTTTTTKQANGVDVHAVHVTWPEPFDDEAASAATERLVAQLASASVRVRDVRDVRSSLEELFADLTRGSDADRKSRAATSAP